MGYTVDYSIDHAFVDGVITGCTLKDGAGATVSSAVRVRRIDQTRADFAGGNFAPSSTDQGFVVWADGLSGTEPEINGTLTVETVVWTIVAVGKRGDGAQYPIFARKQS